MKTGIFVTAALVQLAAAQPHRNHQHHHDKREVVIEYHTVTATTPEAVVFVNQWGNPVSTSWANGEPQHKPTAVPAFWEHSWAHNTPTTTAEAVAETIAAAANEAAPSAAAVESSSVDETPSKASAAPVANSGSSSNSGSDSNSGSSSGSDSSSSSGSSSNSDSDNGLGVTYSPYTASGNCKTQAQVTEDFASLGGYSVVRMYGTDCDQVNTVGTAAIAKGLKLFAGVYDINNVATEVSRIVAFGNANGWKHFDTVSVGNELVNSGHASVSDVSAAVGKARALLKAAGYTGPVVTVDTWTAVLAHPELCECSDYAAINAHAFFDPTATADTAGKFVQKYVNQVSDKCSGKKVVVTESGWPSAGESNGSAQPGKAQQATAVAALKDTFKKNFILFTAYNDGWKKNWDGSFGAEQFWGIYGNAATS